MPVRSIIGLMLLTLLSGCGCRPESGEAVWGKAYWDGCWAEAKGEDR